MRGGEAQTEGRREGGRRGRGGRKERERRSEGVRKEGRLLRRKGEGTKRGRGRGKTVYLDKVKFRNPWRIEKTASLFLSFRPWHRVAERCWGWLPTSLGGGCLSDLPKQLPHPHSTGQRTNVIPRSWKQIIGLSSFLVVPAVPWGQDNVLLERRRDRSLNRSRTGLFSRPLFCGQDLLGCGLASLCEPEPLLVPSSQNPKIPTSPK